MTVQTFDSSKACEFTAAHAALQGNIAYYLPYFMYTSLQKPMISYCHCEWQEKRLCHNFHKDSTASSWLLTLALIGYDIVWIRTSDFQTIDKIFTVALLGSQHIFSLLKHLKPET